MAINFDEDIEPLHVTAVHEVPEGEAVFTRDLPTGQHHRVGVVEVRGGPEAGAGIVVVEAVHVDPPAASTGLL